MILDAHGIPMQSCRGDWTGDCIGDCTAPASSVTCCMQLAFTCAEPLMQFCADWAAPNRQGQDAWVYGAPMDHEEVVNALEWKDFLNAPFGHDSMRMCT